MQGVSLCLPSVNKKSEFNISLMANKPFKIICQKIHEIHCIFDC